MTSKTTAAPRRLTDAIIRTRLKKLKGWIRSGNSITKSYSFKDYHQTMAFVNAVAWIAHGTNHHPDLVVSYNKCVVSYSTHDAGGISARDFESAAKIEQLVDK